MKKIKKKNCAKREHTIKYRCTSDTFVDCSGYSEDTAFCKVCKYIREGACNNVNLWEQQDLIELKPQESLVKKLLDK